MNRSMELITVVVQRKDGQRAIDYIRMTGHPANIGCTPVNLAIFIVKHILTPRISFSGLQ